MVIIPKAIYPFDIIPIKIHDIFQGIRANNPKIHMISQKALNYHSNLDTKEQSWRYSSPRLQTTLQSYSNHNRLVLEQNGEARNKLMLSMVNYHIKRSQEYTLEKKCVFNVVHGKLDSPHKRMKLEQALTPSANLNAKRFNESSHCGTVEMNSTRNYEVVGAILGLAQAME